VKKRLEVYHSQTRPLVDFYNGWAQRGEPGAPVCHRIDGLGALNDIRDAVLAALA
jgi:adenylate kinase